MIALTVVTVTLVIMLCVLAYRLATYALPFMVALGAARYAYGTGASLIGAVLAGLVAAAVSFGILAFLFAAARAPILRVIVAVIFAAPATVAGYALVHSAAAEIVPSPIWHQLFSVISAIAVGISALARLAALLSSGSR
ncbi:hypothetical protein [Kumtagia ephedrae]|uniref:DUF4175 domain-containing protein n=1 Tax=Kumtagia ephedrae TaxID=2116701 RepID=A0A2P7S0Z8_9HYPH|nr:hypothetical protein [Mesorhizobium ephedrae]PSJ56126.1 hypothetical protein C7I84_21375 [Mesorhizobium ephedrae]